MTIAVAAGGYPQLSGVTIPTPLWSTKLLVKFYDASIVPAITNTDYEGEIKKMGEKVRIRTTPDVTIRNYQKGGTLSYETLTPGTIDLDIDKAKYFALQIDDIDAFQSDYGVMEDWTQDASEQMKIEIDTGFLADVPADAHASNQGATAGRLSGDINLGANAAALGITKTNVLEWIVDMGTVLDEQNVPETDRKLVVPA